MADVTVTLGAKDEGLGAAFAGVSKQAAGLTKSVGSALGPIAVLAGAFVATAGAVASFASAVSEGGKLRDLSQALAIPIDELVVLRRAFDNAGASADQVGTVFRKMSDYLFDIGQDAEMVKWFGQFGVSLDELRQKTPTEQFRELAAVLRAMPDGVDKNKMAMDIFGKSYLDILPLISQFDEELESAKKQLGSAPALFAKNAKLLDNVGDSFAAITQKGKEFALGLLDSVLPTFDKVFEAVANMDFSAVGKQLSVFFGQALEGTTSIFGLKTALDSVNLAISQMAAGNAAGAFKTLFLQAQETGMVAINNLSAAGSSAIGTAALLLATVFSPDGAIVHAGKAAFDVLSQYLTAKFAAAMATVADALPLNMGKGMAETLRDASAHAEKLSDIYAFGLGAMPELIGEQLANALANAPKDFQANYEQNLLKPLFEVESVTEQIKKNLENAAAEVPAIDGAKPAATPAVATQGGGVSAMPSGGGGGMSQRSGGGSGAKPKPSENQSYGERIGEFHANQFTGLTAARDQANASGNFLNADRLQKQLDNIKYDFQWREAQNQVEGRGVGDATQSWGDFLNSQWEKIGGSPFTIDGGSSPDSWEKAQFAEALAQNVDAIAQNSDTQEETAQRLKDMTDQLQGKTGGDGTPAGDIASGGKGKPGANQGADGAPKTGLEATVSQIKDLMAQLNAKLPVAALSA